MKLLSKKNIIITSVILFTSLLTHIPIALFFSILFLIYINPNIINFLAVYSGLFIYDYINATNFGLNLLIFSFSFLFINLINYLHYLIKL